MRALSLSIVSLISYVTAAAAAPSQSQTPVFRGGTTDVQVSVSVIANGQSIEGLTAADFVILDEKQPQKILYSGRESIPLDLVLLLDVSGSVHKLLSGMAEVSRAALQPLQPQDRVAVVLFSRDIWIEESFTSNRGDISDSIAKASSEEPPGSGTRIYAAVRSAARYLGSQPSEGVRRQAILIVTDNDSISYDVHKDEVLHALYDGDITLDALVVGRHPRPPSPRPGAAINPDFAFDDVFALADGTGGEAIATNKPKDSLAGILARNRERYVLVYRAPQNAAPGTFRHIEVELAPEARKRYPRVVVRSRAGYYVNGSAQAGSVPK